MVLECRVSLGLSLSIVASARSALASLPGLEAPATAVCRGSPWPFYFWHGSLFKNFQLAPERDWFSWPPPESAKCRALCCVVLLGLGVVLAVSSIASRQSQGLVLTIHTWEIFKVSKVDPTSPRCAQAVGVKLGKWLAGWLACLDAWWVISQLNV